MLKAIDDRSSKVKTIGNFIETYEEFTSEGFNSNGQRLLRAVRFKLPWVGKEGVYEDFVQLQLLHI